MNKGLYALKLGIERGWIDFKRYMTSPSDGAVLVGFAVILLIVLWLQRDVMLGGVSLALMTFPGVVGMLVVYTTFSNASGLLTMEREDGTLLRARTIPQGIQSYLIARVVFVMLTTFVSLLFLLPALFFVQGLDVTFAKTLLFAGVVVLGFLVTISWGAIVGSLTKSSKDGSLLLFPAMALIGISGIFYPITALWTWVQTLAQIFPVYWVGIGVRSALLPAEAVANELGGVWRTWETFAILTAWAIVGLLLAPRVLARMTRRATGAQMQESKARANRY